MVSFNSVMYPFTAEDAMKKEVRHFIGKLKPQDRNLELKVILVKVLGNFETRSHQQITQYLVADSSGSILCNYFGDIGKKMRAGDIVYMDGAYTTIFDGHMILYLGKKGTIYKIGRFFMSFKELPRMSDKKFEQKSSDSAIALS